MTARGARYLILLTVVFGLGLVVRCRCAGGSVRVATFNIENYPRSDRQVAGAFALLDELDVGAVAVQEITDPDHFAREARARLGNTWRFVHSGGASRQRVGVLYDETRFDLRESRVHTETVVYDGAKPVLEARLDARDGERAVRLFSIHLKAGGAHARTRARQLSGLVPVVVDARRSGALVVVAGDYNATGPADRVSIASFAQATGLHWSTQDLECSAYWARKDGCRGSALDHVLTSRPITAVLARGPCETEGCAPGDTCPVFHSEVSDHCPVTADF